jgi:hypothetical protein
MSKDQDHELVVRQRHAQALLDKWKDKSFILGERDCVRLVADHLRRCGHSIKIPAKGSYRTAISALRKLKEAGHGSLSEALDTLGFERIAPAAAILGDIIELRGEDETGKESPLGAMTVVMGNGRVLGFYDGVGCAVLQPNEYQAAWRVSPRK